MCLKVFDWFIVFVLQLWELQLFCMDFFYLIICGDFWGMLIICDLNLLFVKGFCFVFGVKLLFERCGKKMKINVIVCVIV